MIFKGKTWPDTSVLTHVDGTPGQLSGITPNQVAAPRPPRSPSGDRAGCSPSARHFYWSRQIGLFQKKLGQSLVLSCNLSPLFFSFSFLVVDHAHVAVTEKTCLENMGFEEPVTRQLFILFFCRRTSCSSRVPFGLLKGPYHRHEQVLVFPRQSPEEHLGVLTGPKKSNHI